MSHKVLRVATLAVLCLALTLGGAGIAAAATSKGVDLDHVQVIVGNETSGIILIDVKAGVAKGTPLPAKVVLEMPAAFKPYKAYTFATATPTKETKVAYSVKTKKVKTKEGTIAMNFITLDLKNNDAVEMVFQSDPMLINSTGHLIMGMPWFAASNIKTMLIGSPAPDGMVPVGKKVTLLGTDAKNRKIYGYAYNNVKAGSETVMQMGFIQESVTEAAKKKAAETKTAGITQRNKVTNIVLISAGALLIVVLIILIVLVVRNHHAEDGNDYDLDEDLDEESGEDEE